MICQCRFDSLNYAQAFFNCTFADKDWLVRSSIWRWIASSLIATDISSHLISFTCANAAWVYEDEELFDLCARGEMPLDVVQDACTSSNTRVLKIMALEWLASHQSTLRGSFQWIHALHTIIITSAFTI